MAILRKSRVFKSSTPSLASNSHADSHESGWRRKSKRHLEGELIRLAEHGEGRCHCPLAGQGQAAGTFLVMASQRRWGGLNAKLVVPWKQEKVNGVSNFDEFGEDLLQIVVYPF